MIVTQVLLKTEMTPEWKTMWAGALASPTQSTGTENDDVRQRIEAHDLTIDEQVLCWQDLREAYPLKSRVDENATDLPLGGDAAMLGDGEDVFGDDADLQEINMDDLDDDDENETEELDVDGQASAPAAASAAPDRLQRAGTETDDTEDEFVHV